MVPDWLHKTYEEPKETEVKELSENQKKYKELMDLSTNELHKGNFAKSLEYLQLAKQYN